MDRFRDSASERVFEGRPVRRLPAEIQRRARMRLQRVVAATALSDLRLPPSHRLKALSGDRKGQHSIRINDQWRVCFRWTDRGAREIEVTDYH
ncbi:MAG: type II toxin-antitoxin system RelE/ParE family toxin [Acidobacteria bacterium]|nr:type II toxin-antitoxin system RelE/ParE family toxin [Acidobacteriota bacterium]